MATAKDGEMADPGQAGEPNQQKNNVSMASTKEGGVADPGQPREPLIGTAIKFLQNAKVRESPFPQRRNFLKQKGLTDEEIQIAIDRSGTSADEASHPAQTSQNQSQLVSAGSPLTTAIQTVPISKWSRFRDFTSTAILIGGVSYAVYILFKHYLTPHLFRPSREEQQLERLTQSVTELQQTITSVLHSLQETQKTLSTQQDTLQLAVVDSASGRGSKEMLNMQNTQFVTEIKEEIKSLKGLLLNRRQFPVAPTTTPRIPAWQLETSQSKSGTTDTVTPSELSTGETVSQSGRGTTDIANLAESGSVEDSVITGTEPSSSTVTEGFSEDETTPTSESITCEPDQQTEDIMQAEKGTDKQQSILSESGDSLPGQQKDMNAVVLPTTNGLSH